MAMATTPLPKKCCSVEEYLAFEVETTIRHEYRNGIILPMTGGTPTHNKIMSALNALLWFSLRGKDYSLFVADQRLWIPAANLYTYPDVMVVANPVELKPGRKDTIVNPLLIIEILSDSTEQYDRGDKFAAYQTIATFHEYVLVDQSRCHVEHYAKQVDDQWRLIEYDQREENLRLRSLEVTLALSDLYEAIVF